MSGVLLSTLKEELAAVRQLEREYQKKIAALPRGSFIVRKIGGGCYGYLTRRQEGRVIQEYLGPLNEKGIDRYRESKKQRKKYKAQLKSVREQIKILKRALRGKTT